MFKFDEFIHYIRNHIISGWLSEKEYQAYTYPVQKNNGCICTGLYIRKMEDKVLRLICLEDYYERYLRGIPLEEVMNMIREDYQKQGDVMEIRDESLMKINLVQDRIIFRLVNYERNQSLLRDCPHVRIGDLALTFRWLASKEKSAIATVLIRQAQMDMWDVDMAFMIKKSFENMQKLFPPVISRIGEAFEKIAGMPLPGLGDDDILDQVPLYVLTNDSNTYGASCVLYPECLMDFAAAHNEDYYILPSSVHEVLLMPVREGVDPDMLRQTIHEVNQVAVSWEDYLSDTLYLFERSVGRLRMLRE